MVTKLQFSQLFSKAWVKAINPETIVSGFRKTGVCPLNKDAIHIATPPSLDSSLSSDNGDIENFDPMCMDVVTYPPAFDACASTISPTLNRVSIDSNTSPSNDDPSTLVEHTLSPTN